MMITPTHYFPTHLALGQAFCNRKQELKRLKIDIEGANPALIMSPRRYGKTSLAINTFTQIGLPYAHIDFYKELSETDIQHAILNGIGKLLSQFETTAKRLIQLASDLFADLEIKLILEKAGLKLVFDKNKSKASNTISAALEKLHDYAKKKNKKGILYFDEFQVVGEVTENHAIEAAIREAAQKSTHIAYIFSGSNRHLMQQMFYDKKRPFYKLCDVLILERIATEDYEPFIQHAAQEKWHKNLTEDTLENIFTLTENHPYYVNKLCSLLWLNHYPSAQQVLDCWQKYQLENTSLTEREIELLSINQRKILIYIAKENIVKKLFGKTAANSLDMPLSSIAKSISSLMEKDYVYLDKNNCYRVLDPLVKSILAA